MSKRLELIGQRFERLIVIGFSHINKWENVCWLCKCDCGKHIIVIGYSLRNGHTRSCGCLWKENLEKEQGKLRLPKGISARNAILRQHTIVAKRRNLEHALTDEQIIALHKENCHYCDAPPSNIYSHPDYNGSYTYTGIDRVDNSKGYTIDNVAPCCFKCNNRKRTKTYDEFLEQNNKLKIA